MSWYFVNEVIVAASEDFTQFSMKSMAIAKKPQAVS